MSISDLDLFPPESGSMRDPQFTTTRNGYNPREVEDFIHQMADQVETLRGDVKRLERALRQAQVEGESARQRYATAKSEVYDEFAARMAELLRTADLQAEKVRREADEAASKQLSEAQTQAERTVRQATVEADRLRWEGKEAVKRAKAEADKVVQEITTFRRSVRGELQVLHDRLVTVVEELGATIAIPEAEAVHEEEGHGAPSGSEEPPPPSARSAQEPIAESVSTDAPAAATSAGSASPAKTATADGVVDLREVEAESTGGGGQSDGRSTEGPSAAEGGVAETVATGSPEWNASAAPPQGKQEGAGETVEAEDLLSTVQGFDLVLPEFSDVPEEE